MNKYIGLLLLCMSLFFRDLHIQKNKKPHINTATYEELLKVDYIYHKRAKSIMDNMPFTDRDDLIKRTNLGEVTTRILEQKFEL